MYENSYPLLTPASLTSWCCRSAAQQQWLGGMLCRRMLGCAASSPCGWCNVGLGRRCQLQPFPKRLHCSNSRQDGGAAKLCGKV